MAIKGTERDSVHSLKGLKPESTVNKHTPAKTEPRFGTALRKVSRSELSLKGQKPESTVDNHKPAKTEPRFGTALRKVSRSTLSLKGQKPEQYTLNLPE